MAKLAAEFGQRRTADLPLGPAGVVRHSNNAKGKARLARVNLDESPLSWLFARDLITARQFDAGEALRRDYESAAMAPSITMGWDRLPTGRVDGGGAAGGLSQSERQVAARQRFDGAIAALGGGLSDIAWRVLCAGEAIGAAEKGLGWPTRSAKLVLTLALDRLAEYYRVR